MKEINKGRDEDIIEKYNYKMLSLKMVEKTYIMKQNITSKKILILKLSEYLVSIVVQTSCH